VRRKGTFASGVQRLVSSIVSVADGRLRRAVIATAASDRAEPLARPTRPGEQRVGALDAALGGMTMVILRGAVRSRAGRLRLVVGTTLGLALLLGSAGAAAADPALVVPYSSTSTSVTNWNNPCTGQATVVTTTIETSGQYVVDAHGGWHFQDRSVGVEGSDNFGWDVTKVTVIAHREGVGYVYPDDVTTFTWLLHLRLSDPATGQGYGGTFLVHFNLNGSGQLVTSVERGVAYCTGPA
jgi:hypothetical protein